MLLQRPAAGAPEAQHFCAADRDTQLHTHLDRESLGYRAPNLDQPGDLFSDSGHAQPDALQDCHTIQHLDAAADGAAHGGLYTPADPIRDPFADADQYPASFAERYRYGYLNTQPVPHCDRYTRPVAYCERYAVWSMSERLTGYLNDYGGRNALSTYEAIRIYVAPGQIFYRPGEACLSQSLF